MKKKDINDINMDRWFELKRKQVELFIKKIEIEIQKRDL